MRTFNAIDLRREYHAFQDAALAVQNDPDVRKAMEDYVSELRTRSFTGRHINNTTFDGYMNSVVNKSFKRLIGYKFECTLNALQQNYETFRAVAEATAVYNALGFSSVDRNVIPEVTQSVDTLLSILKELGSPYLTPICALEDVRYAHVWVVYKNHCFSIRIEKIQEVTHGALEFCGKYPTLRYSGITLKEVLVQVIQAMDQGISHPQVRADEGLRVVQEVLNSLRGANLPGIGHNVTYGTLLQQGPAVQQWFSDCIHEAQTAFKEVKSQYSDTLTGEAYYAWVRNVFGASAVTTWYEDRFHTVFQFQNPTSPTCTLKEINEAYDSLDDVLSNFVACLKDRGIHVQEILQRKAQTRGGTWGIVYFLLEEETPMSVLISHPSTGSYDFAINGRTKNLTRKFYHILKRKSLAYAAGVIAGYVQGSLKVENEKLVKST